MNKEREVIKNLVSVVIPCYNSEATIIACLESVIGQQYPHIEVIVVDDGSTDRTVKVVETFIDRSTSGIKTMLYRSANFGPSTARNIAISKTSGEFISFLDSDDVWQPHKLKTQISLFESHPHLVLVGCSHPFVPQKAGAPAWRNISLQQLLYKNYFQTSSVVLRATSLGDDLFRIQQKYSEDYDLWLRIATKGDLALLSEPLTIAEVSPYLGKGLSSRLWQMEKGELGNYQRLYHRNNISSKDFIFASAFSLGKFFYRIFKTISPNNN